MTKISKFSFSHEAQLTEIETQKAQAQIQVQCMLRCASIDYVI